MAFRYAHDTAFDPLPTGSLSRRQRFVERFPDYPTWFDGNVWAIPAREILDTGMGIAGFRSSLHYQAKVLGVTIVTKMARDPEYTHVFLVKATNQD